MEGDQEVLDNCHVKPFVLLLALKSCTLLMSLVLLLLSGCYKTINSFTPYRDKILLLKECEKNKMGGNKSCILQWLLTSKSQLYTISAYFSIFKFWKCLFLPCLWNNKFEINLKKKEEEGKNQESYMKLKTCGSRILLWAQEYFWIFQSWGDLLLLTKNTTNMTNNAKIVTKIPM